MDKGDIKVGDRVRVFTPACEWMGRPASWSQPLRVTAIRGQHYYDCQHPDGITEEGTILELENGDACLTRNVEKVEG